MIEVVAVNKVVRLVTLVQAPVILVSVQIQIQQVLKLLIQVQTHHRKWLTKEHKLTFPKIKIHLT